MSLVDRSRVLLFALLTLCFSCSQEVVHVPEAREAIAVRFADVPELEVREAPSADAPIVITYRLGESVSVLSEREGWAEVRVGYDDSGWVPLESLASEKATFESASEAKARFVTPPNPVFSPGGVEGMIHLEAAVNTEGDVTSVRVIRNTTGSEGLASQNVAALQKAKFYPMVIDGRTKPFVYDHVVNY